jgi:predicted glycosyltransferase
VPGFIKTIDDVLKKYLDSVSLGFSEPSISLYDYLSLSNAILLTGGTLALEAMVLGCIPIIYINDAQFSHNPMTDYRKAVIAVRDLFSMQKALETIGDTEATKNLKRNWSEPLSEIFGDFSVDPNKRFIETLQENFNIL